MGDKKRYLLRIDEDLKLYIARKARLNDRSLNQEINYRLRLSKELDESCSSIKRDNINLKITDFKEMMKMLSDINSVQLRNSV